MEKLSERIKRLQDRELSLDGIYDELDGLYEMAVELESLLLDSAGLLWVYYDRQNHVEAGIFNKLQAAISANKNASFLIK